MIIVSKCPCRISLLGGGSDLEWFVKKHGFGQTIGFSVPIFSRVAIGFRSNNTRGLLNYSSREEYLKVESISHPIIRACLTKFSISKPIEMASFGDALMGGGLASSSSFTVAIIKAIYNLLEKNLSNEEAAHLACEIEISDLKNPIGRQDQYLCALGGINYLEFRKDKNVTTKDYPYISKAIIKYTNNLFLINTSISRSANKQLLNIKNKDESINQIENILEISNKFLHDSKKSNDIDEILNYLDSSISASWEIKKTMQGVINDNILKIERLINIANFRTIKILGAGGGGYILIKYEGNNLKKDKKSLENNHIDLIPVNIHSKGCETWKI